MLLDKLLNNIPKEYRGSVLNRGANESEISRAESKIGIQFPEILRQLYREADGENGTLLQCPTRPFMFFDAFEFLTLERLVEIHSDQLYFENEEILERGLCSSPEGYIKVSFFNRKWIPIGWSGSSSYVAIDMDPGVLGKAGQVILFGVGLRPDLHMASPNLLQFIDDVSRFVSDFQSNGTEEEASYEEFISDLYR